MQWVWADDVARAAIAANVEARLVHVPRTRLLAAGGSIMAPPNYFGVYLDIPAITARSARVTDELGITLTPLEEGLRATFAWYRQQPRVARDYAWEDAVLAGVG